MEIVEVPEQPALLVPTTVYVMLPRTSGLTRTLAVVAETPGNHAYDTPPAALSVVFPAPWQTVVCEEVTEIVGGEATVTENVATSKQVLLVADVTVTVYEVAAVGEIVILAVVAPVLQE
jgi:hypothetical protein